MLFGLFSILLLGFTIGNMFYNIKYKVSLTQATVIGLMNAKPEQLFSFISPFFFLFFLLLLLLIVLGFLFLAHKERKKQRKANKKLIITLLYGLLGLSPFFMQEVFNTYYPYNILKIFVGYVDLRFYLGQKPPHIDKSSQLQKGPNPILTVFYIGESLRADHMSLNNPTYRNQTTPFLEKENLINFGIGQSCATSTVESIPCFTTSQGNSQSLVSRLQEQSFMDILDKKGFDTYFLGTKVRWPLFFYLQDTGKTGQYISSLGKEDLQYQLQLLLENQKLSSQTALLLRNEGSHFDYVHSYPADFMKWKPICGFRRVNTCPLKELSNNYDNSILYTDYILGSILNQLKKVNQPILFLFTSDHAESLGEKGAFGHTNNFTENRMIPIIFWVNQAYIKQYPAKYEALLKNQKLYKDQITHNALWHSVLDGSGIYNKKRNGPLVKTKSLFSPFFKAELKKDWYKAPYERN